MTGLSYQNKNYHFIKDFINICFINCDSKMDNLPKISFIIPTYNAGNLFDECLNSIVKQDYPNNLFEILIIDGGSTDNTLKIAKKHDVKIINNKFKIEEKGRPLGIRKSKGKIICFIDQDNILPNKNWLKNMIVPFKENDIFAADTLYYSYKKNDDVITKYNALIGGDDPIAAYLGINDRLCYFNNKWTGQPHKRIEKKEYIKVYLNKDKIPAMGSNGFLIRKNILMKIKFDPFNHPEIISLLVKKGYNKYAKVKCGLYHKQDGSFRTFYKKKLRRVKRRYSDEKLWKQDYGLEKEKILFITVYCATFIFPLFDAVKGFIRKPSLAWLFHPIATTSLIFIYMYYALKSRI